MDSLKNINIADWIVNFFHSFNKEAFFVLIIGIPVLLILRRMVRNVVTRQHSEHYGILLSKLTFWFGLPLVLVTALNQMGYSLGPLLGAAGIVGVALGVASQTSISNIVSGFFLIAERSFKVGDIIQVDLLMGEVLNVDTLSVKLRTFDNKFVRVPNEKLLKSEVTNITKFPIRRIDVLIRLHFNEDLARIKELLIEVATTNHQVLQEPEPQFFVRELGEYFVQVQFSAWAVREEFIPVKNALIEQILKAFTSHQVQIPYPHTRFISAQKDVVFSADSAGISG